MHHISVTNTDSDNTSSINNTYFIHKVRRGETHIWMNPRIPEKEDGFRLIGPGAYLFYPNKSAAIDYGMKIMYVYLCGQDDMKAQFRRLLDV